VPAGVTFDEAATVPLCALTAAQVCTMLWAGSLKLTMYLKGLVHPPRNSSTLP